MVPVAKKIRFEFAFIPEEVGLTLVPKVVVSVVVLVAEGIEPVADTATPLKLEGQAEIEPNWFV